MTLRVLEFNDTGLRLSDASGVIATSPAYALVLAKQLEFGERARALSRINPLHTYNQFWYKLSVDPFAKPVGHFRHNADLAFSHLQHFADSAQVEGDVLLAVPGSFSRQQMAILLGLMKQGPMRATGIVDASVLATIDRPSSESFIHADLQLHQVVLSKLRRVGNELQRDSVLLVPDVGWEHIVESLMHLFTTAFIQQCRFNPQHDALSEQMLLDSLPQCLFDEGGPKVAQQSREESQRSLKISLSHNGSVHEASLARSSLHNRLHVFYQKIQQQLHGLDPSGVFPVYISDRLGLLPQFRETIAHSAVQENREVIVLPEDAIAASALRYKDALTSTSEAVHFISKLGGRQPRAAQEKPASAERCTHLLFSHKAWPLGDGLALCLGADSDAGPAKLHVCALQSVPSQARVLARLHSGADGFVLTATGKLELNGQALHGDRPLKVGDRLQFAELQCPVDVIAVCDANV